MSTENSIDEREGREISANTRSDNNDGDNHDNGGFPIVRRRERVAVRLSGASRAGRLCGRKQLLINMPHRNICVVVVERRMI